MIYRNSSMHTSIAIKLSIDRAVNHHSEALHVLERCTLIGPDHIAYEVTIEDPKCAR